MLFRSLDGDNGMLLVEPSEPELVALREKATGPVPGVSGKAAATTRKKLMLLNPLHHPKHVPTQNLINITL